MSVNLLRPEQRSGMLANRDALIKKLQNENIEDKGTVRNQLRRLERQIETQTPKPFKPTEVDSSVNLEKDLREQILRGMPSQEEMRKNPPGAVGKHQAWEKRNKAKLLKWKETVLRLNHDSTDPDVANFERHRPVRSTLNMDNAQISGTSHFMPPTSPEYQEGHERIFGSPAKEKKKSRKWTPEQRDAARKRMKDINAKKRGATPQE